MGIFNLLPDKEKLDKYITDYAPYDEVDNSKTAASLEFLMRFWEANKSKYLYKLLGNEFILEKEYEYVLSSREIEDRITNKMYDEEDMRAFIDAFVTHIMDYYETSRFKRYYHWFIEQYPDASNRDIYWNLRSLVSAKSLAKNVYEYENCVIPLPGEEHKVLRITTGMKIMKILSKLSEAWELPGFEAFRLKHSLVLNQKKLKGTICLSIHPLDYLTMSDNSLGWESCMNWTKGGGCYRQGTVEMMNSPMVIVAYLKSQDPFYFEGKESWNNKKWRNLYIVHPDIITGVKSYPYYNESLDEFCTSWLANLAAQNLGWKYGPNWGTIHPSKEFEIEYLGSDGNTYSATFRFETEIMYLDFGNGNIINPCIREGAEDINTTIDYSGPSECMYCGNQVYLDDLEDEGSVLCNDCVTLTYCDCCGERIRNDDVYELDGNCYCRSCYEERCVYDYDNEAHDIDNCKEVYIVDEPKYENFERAYSFFIYESDNAFFENLLVDECTGVKYKSFNNSNTGYYSPGYYYVLTSDLNDSGREVLRSYLPKRR